MPETRGNVMSAHMFVEADMAGNMVNRRSRKGILIFRNRAPILWHSKRQTMVEISMFGSEFTAMKTGIELVEGLRYKLRMFGIPLKAQPMFSVTMKLCIRAQWFLRRR